jgi:hypothetical protein
MEYLHRTAYLDKSVTAIINGIVANETTAAEIDYDAIIIRPRRKAKIRLIVMGGGYDTRSMKLLERYLLLENDEKNRNDVNPRRHDDHLRRKMQRRQHLQLRIRRRLKGGHSEEKKQSHAFDKNSTSLLSLASLSSSNCDYNLECYELDLPEVVRAKRQLIQTRLHRRRPWLKQMTTGTTGDYPNLVPVNFNDLNETRKALEGILQFPSSKTEDDYLLASDGNAAVGAATNIILFEGVMIYLDEGIPHSLLQLCSDVLNERHNTSTDDGASSLSPSSGYLCFADRLENIPGGDVDAAHVELASTGWALLDWLPKPGLARHMGVARLRT